MHHLGLADRRAARHGLSPMTLDRSISDRPGTWNPTGDNDANLRAMVANPHDLVEGTGQDASAGAEAAPPVARVLAGKRYPLPTAECCGSSISWPSRSNRGTANPGHERSNAADAPACGTVAPSVGRSVRRSERPARR